MLLRFCSPFFIVLYMGDLLGGITFSWIVSSAEPSCGGGASGGIFALIAALLVCYQTHFIKII